MAASVIQIIEHHRTLKAQRLAETLLAHGFTWELTRQLDDHGWHIVAAKAGVKPPSTTTQALVLEILSRDQQAA